MKRNIAYLYVRYSSEAQSGGDSYRRQVERAKDYCSKNDLILNSNYFFDDAKSAYNHYKIRDEFNRMIEMIESGEIKRGSTIIMDSADRLGREGANRNFTLLGRMMEKVNIIILAATGEPKKFLITEKDNVFDIIGVALDSSRAHNESREKSKNIREAWEAKKAELRNYMSSINPKEDLMRIILTTQIPEHLELVNKDIVKIGKKKQLRAEFKIREGYKEAIEEIFELARSSFSDEDIARELNKNKRCNKTDWNSTEVNRLIRKKVVLGEYQPKSYLKVNDEHLYTDKYIYKGRQFTEKDLAKRFNLTQGDPIAYYFPQVIDEGLYNEVQAVRRRRTTKKYGKTGSNFANIFQKILVCDRCEMPLHRVRKGKKKPYHKEKVYYKCRSGRERGCSQTKLYDAEILDHNILRFCDRIDLDLLFNQKNSQSRTLSQKCSNLEEEINEIENNIEYYISQMDKFASKKMDTPDRIYKKLSELEQDLKIKKENLVISTQDLAAVSRASNRTNKELSDLLEQVHDKDSEIIRKKLNGHLRSFIEEIVCFYNDQQDSKDAMIVFSNGDHKVITLDTKLDMEYIGALAHEFQSFKKKRL